jgi:hypothetical protein
MLGSPRGNGGGLSCALHQLESTFSPRRRVSFGLWKFRGDVRAPTLTVQNHAWRGGFIFRTNELELPGKREVGQGMGAG